jgi:hypothetical protein
MDHGEETMNAGKSGCVKSIKCVRNMRRQKLKILHFAYRPIKMINILKAMSKLACTPLLPKTSVIDNFFIQTLMFQKSSASSKLKMFGSSGLPVLCA